MNYNAEQVNEYLKNLNPFKEDPRETRIKEMAKYMLANLNKTLAKIYYNTRGKNISNYPTDEMISFVTTDRLSTLGMTQVLSMIYDEQENCFILSDILYDEHQKSLTTDSEFNSLLLWTRIFSKQNMIELKEHNKENKLIKYKVLDNRIVDNLKEFSMKDLEEMRKIMQQADMKQFENITSKYDAEFLKNKSVQEIEEIATRDAQVIIENFMNNVNGILNKLKKEQ